MKNTLWCRFLKCDIDGKVVGNALNTYSTKETAIATAKAQGWDKVLNDVTQAVLWQRDKEPEVSATLQQLLKETAEDNNWKVTINGDRMTFSLDWPGENIEVSVGNGYPADNADDFDTYVQRANEAAEIAEEVRNLCAQLTEVESNYYATEANAEPNP